MNIHHAWIYAVMLLIWPMGGYSETLKAGSLVCESREIYHQMREAIRRNDQHGIDWLMKHGCIYTSRKLPVSILWESEDPLDTDQEIRVYIGDESFVLWTYMDNTAAFGQ